MANLRPLYYDAEGNQIKVPNANDVIISSPDVTFNTIADLKAYDIYSNAGTKTAEVLGYYAPNDGGGGFFNFVSDATDADNGGTLIRPTAYTTQGVWKRLISDYVTIKQFGAKGDGVTDDYLAISSCVSFCNDTRVRMDIPHSNNPYQVSECIELLTGIHIKGTSNRDYCVIRKSTDNTKVLENNGNLNGVFYVGNSARYVKIESINIVGQTTRLSSGIIIGGTSFLTLNEVKFSALQNGIETVRSLYMSSFKNCHATGCVTAYNFYNTGAKTSLTFDSCWAENCGNAYQFSFTYYSQFSSCGADYISYIDSSPYGTPQGNQETSRGVYDLRSCDGIVLNGCGAENVYGWGAVNANSSESIVLNAFRVTNMNSDYTPPFNQDHGIIVSEQEGMYITINGLSLTSCDESKFTTTSVENTGVIANNRSASAYGDPNEARVIVSNAFGVGGFTNFFVGDDYKNFNFTCILLSDFSKGGGFKTLTVTEQLTTNDITTTNKITTEELRVNKNVQIGISHIYSGQFTPSGTGTTLSIPVIGQLSENKFDLLKVTWKENPTNTTTGDVGYVIFTAGRLDTAKTPFTIIEETATGGITHSLTGNLTSSVNVVLSSAIGVASITIEILANDGAKGWDIENSTWD